MEAHFLERTLFCSVQSINAVVVVRVISSHVAHLSERDTNQAASICKKGADVVDCPDQATCGGGAILSCSFFLERKMDGSACVLTAEAEEEVDAVVQALR